MSRTKKICRKKNEKHALVVEGLKWTTSTILLGGYFPLPQGIGIEYRDQHLLKDCIEIVKHATRLTAHVLSVTNDGMHA